MAYRVPRKSASPTRSIDSSRFPRQYLLALLLVAIIVVVFWRVAGYEFVNYDDDQYVYQNPHLRSGLSWEGITWAFTSVYASNWHPVTWLSHLLDVQLFGLDAGWHHCINLLLHCANAVLLLLILFHMTQAPWRSAFVAALFALHPLHVESVAWIAERKDVLSTFFLLLTIGAYARYAKRPCRARYLIVVALFALGLMSKPMLVTLPFVLLLLDWWPLGRVTRFDGETLARLIREKLPLLLLSLASSVATYAAQVKGGAVRSLQAYPLGIRIAHAFVSYATYAIKTVWPSSLAVFYQHPWLTRGGDPDWQVAGAVILIAAISFLALRQVRRRPYLTVGWLWYLGTLIPVIGLVQAGSQSMADKYTYVPLIGLFVMIAWGGSEVLASLRTPTKIAAALGVTLLGSLAAASWFQVAHWQNNVTLYTHALQVTAHLNWIANYNLGRALEAQGKLEESIPYYLDALRAAPNDARAHNNVGSAFAAQGKFDEAIRLYREALRLDPKYAEIHDNLGNALAARGNLDEAISHYREAIRLDPKCADAYRNLGNLLISRGEVENAIANYRLALSIDSDDVLTHNNLGNVLAAQGNIDEAITHFREALRLDPKYAEIHDNLGNALAARGNLDEAVNHYREALRLDPKCAEAYRDLGDLLIKRGDAENAIANYRLALSIEPDDVLAHNGLANALIRQGNIDEAIANYREAIRINPAYAEVYCNLGLALAKRGRIDEAVTCFREALRLKPGFPAALQYLELALGKK